jgi:hypothetical protein
MAKMEEARPTKAKKRLLIGRLGKSSGSSDSWVTVRAEETASNNMGVGIEGAMLEAMI